MTNRKAYAIICWIVAAIAFLAALLISEGKIEDVIFYFDRLDNDEKLECIQKLEKMISDSK